MYSAGFEFVNLPRLCVALRQVVYLDVDVVVRGDLAELYNVPMSPALTDLNHETRCQDSWAATTCAGTANGAPGTVAAVQRSNQPLRTYVDVLQPAGGLPPPERNFVLLGPQSYIRLQQGFRTRLLHTR